jgi:acetoacetyl-CoA reductase
MASVDAKGISVNAIAPGYVDTEMARAVPADVLEKSLRAFQLVD